MAYAADDYSMKANPEFYAEPEPAKRGNVSDAEERAHKQLCVLDEALRNLDKRLTPVLRAPRPEPSTDLNAAKPSGESDRSELASSLDDLRALAHRLTRYVHDLADRVDL